MCVPEIADILLGWVQITWHLEPRPLMMASSRMNWGTCAQCNKKTYFAAMGDTCRHSVAYSLHLSGFTAACLPTYHCHLILTNNLQDFFLLLPWRKLLTKLLWYGCTCVCTWYPEFITAMNSWYKHRMGRGKSSQNLPPVLKIVTCTVQLC